MAVGLPGGIVEETLREWQRTAESIIPLVDRVLSSAGTGLEKIDLLAISSGPGSFTALRIGMAAAKGMAYGRGLPLVTISTMEALAVSARDCVDAECLVPVIPARKGEFYFSFRPRGADTGWQPGKDIAYAPVGRLEELLEPWGGQCAVVARDVAPLEDVCRKVGAKAVKADFFTAASLIPMAEEKFAAGDLPPLETVIPDYQQKFRPKA